MPEIPLTPPTPAVAVEPQAATQQTRANAAFTALRDEILSGRLPLGSKINEPQLSRQLGISRGPLREAIRQLEGCRLVTIQPNIGAKIISLNEKQIADIYEIRESLEGLACRLAAARASTEQCLELRRILALHEQTLEREPTSSEGASYPLQEGDLDFHQQILRMSGNSQLLHMLGSEMYDLLRLYRRQTVTEPRRPQRAVNEHQGIVAAIEAGDGELAQLLMQRHIQNAKKILIS
jgi:DNA-binding GntR family transcriptional regulator